MDRSINNIEDDQELSHLFVSLREKLERIPSISSDCCIFRVPKRLRELNEKAYTPRVVSIGPLHHDNEDLRAMEVPKLRYLKNFLQRTNHVSMEEYLNLLKGREERLRNSYGEPIKLPSNKFLEMILVDAAFVIEVTPNANFQSDLGLDSLDAVEIVMALEEEFGFEIPDNEADKINSINLAVEFIASHPQAK